ncbi:MAG: TolC family protein [Proteobacteria bacterium]|nr:TolC family protein [Pseudomonadota bacterium]MDA0992721.1 TolC family protein [Pseudomonadota bacterium]
MLSVIGQLPRKNQKHSEVRDWSLTGRGLLVSLAIVVSGMSAAEARQAIPLTLAEAERVALELEPGQAALLARAAALEEESVVAGQLPDPTMRIGMANFPLESGGFSTEAMTQLQLGFRQSFPPGETREVSTRRFQSLALEMKESADGRSRDVLAAVRQAWLETYYWQQAHAIVDRSRPFFSDLVTVTRDMYSVGRKDQQDVLRAELELSRIDDRRISFNNNHARAIAALSQWLDSAASRPIAEKLPAWQQIPPLELLHGNLLDHPDVRAADARIAARQAGVDLAEEQFKPGWAMDLGYGHRDGTLANGAPRSDFVSLSVTMDMPFFKKNRQDRKLAAALRERSAVTASKEELLRRLRSRLDGEYAQWNELSRRIDLYEEQILKQAGDNAEASLVAYQSDTADFADVMRAYIDDLNSKVDHTRLQVERAKSYAILANLGGISE